MIQITSKQFNYFLITDSLLRRLISSLPFRFQVKNINDLKLNYSKLRYLILSKYGLSR